MNLKSPEGIYIHIPFCISKCSYCNFYSVAKPTELLLTDYITCLLNEITQTRQKSKQMAGIRSLYMGGGTPSSLKVKQIEQIVKHIRREFNLDLDQMETTIEVNPGTVDYTTLHALRDIGFNRISIGIQSLNDKLLALMNRSHSAKEGILTLENALKAKFTNISCDLIFGYPTQTKELVLSSLEEILKFPIKHLSVYSLSVEPETRLFRQIENKKLKLWDEDLERKTYKEINNRLKINGFNHYEISNYSLKGFESKQNMLYWSLGSYFGFGPAASSFLDGMRVDRPADLRSYLSNKPIPKENIHKLSERELKEEFMFLGLRKLNGISDLDYKKIFNASFYNDFKNALNKLKSSGFIEINKEKVRLTESGADFADRVALEFLL